MSAMTITQHGDYPHVPGYLYDCPACDSQCFCTPGNAECVFEGEHNGTADRTYCTCPPHVQCPAVRAPYDETAPAYCEHCGLDMDPNVDAPDILA